jgi:hypothetical protein
MSTMLEEFRIESGRSLRFVLVERLHTCHRQPPVAFKAQIGAARAPYTRWVECGKTRCTVTLRRHAALSRCTVTLYCRARYRG